MTPILRLQACVQHRLSLLLVCDTRSPSALRMLALRGQVNLDLGLSITSTRIP